MFGEQRELEFHNTVPLEESALPEAREKASAQKKAILKHFMDHYPLNFTPAEVWERLQTPLLLTSVRRCITDLTKEGKLYKCMYSESRKGQYGTLNRTWKYNPDWMPPINPKK
jgi:hypothetical protein